MGAAAGRCWRATGAGLMLFVRLTPKSSRDEVEGVETRGDGHFLKARVRAVPDKGMANAALEKLIAKWLGVPASSVSLGKGGKSRLKSVCVAGDAEILKLRLETLLAGK